MMMMMHHIQDLAGGCNPPVGNLTPDPCFDDPSYWNTGSSWQVVDGKGVYDASVGGWTIQTTITMPVTNGNTYRLSVYVSDIQAGKQAKASFFMLGSGSFSIGGFEKSTSGNYSVDFVYSGIDRIVLRVQGTSNVDFGAFKIDNLTIVKL